MATSSMQTQPLLSYADRLAQASQSRHGAIQQRFGSSLFALTSLMGPISEGPEWPSDAGWIALQHGDCACIMSDGLSDPWVETDRLATGLGLEVFIESPAIHLPENETPMALADTWLFPMTAEISHTLASYPRLCSKLLAGEPLSLRFNIEHIKDGRGLVGTLLHVPQTMDATLPTALGPVQLIAGTLLTGDELAWLAGKGEQGRRDLLEKLYQQGIGSQSLPDRSSLV